MKIIIIDGPDNTGKNTIIHNIIDRYDSVKIIHCHKPGDLIIDPLREMTRVYYKYADDTITDYKNRTVDAVVFNRFYIGEWVYGQLYRNENPADIKTVIFTIEQFLLSNICYEDIYYIQLMSSSPELLKKYDDGRSLSEAEMDKIFRELVLFREGYSMSSLKKKTIYVNDHDSFRPKQEITDEVNDFISDGYDDNKCPNTVFTRGTQKVAC